MEPSHPPIRVAIIGASGRMGRALVRSAPEFPNVTLAAAVASQASHVLGQDAGVLAGLGALGLSVTSDLPDALARSDVALDFSNAGATPSNLGACRRARKALIIGTTGLGAGFACELAAAAEEIPLLVAPNTSIGVTVLMELVRAAARALPRQFDIEIIEAHHRMKRDAPSGTALALGRAAGEGRGQRVDTGGAAVRGSGLRREGEIGFAAVRAGDIVGDHTVLFAGEGERLCLGHQATDRAVFARGAFHATAWLVLQPPGLYSMSDIISINS